MMSLGSQQTRIYRGFNMEFNWSYWLVAWIFMGLTFLIATGAILMGAFALDKENKYPDEGTH